MLPRDGVIEAVRRERQTAYQAGAPYPRRVTGEQGSESIAAIASFESCLGRSDAGSTHAGTAWVDRSMLSRL